MAKTMKMEELIDRASEEYRSNKKKLDAVSTELDSVCVELKKHKEDGCTNITVAAYKALKDKKSVLINEQIMLKGYCDGVFNTREILMDLGFDVNVETDEE